MKILEAGAGALTNFEVLDLLRSRGAGTDLSRAIAFVSPSEYKVFDYLELTPACNQTRDIISRCFDECKRYDLSKAEILNIANMRPASPVEVYPIIEDCESRMEDKIDELVETIMRIFPPHPSQKDEACQENAENNEEAGSLSNSGFGYRLVSDFTTATLIAEFQSRAKRVIFH